MTSSKPKVVIVANKNNFEDLALILKNTFHIIYLHHFEFLPDYMEKRNPDIVIIEYQYVEAISRIFQMASIQVGNTSKASTFVIIEDEAERNCVFKAGCSGFLLKPFEKLDAISQLTRQLSLRQAKAALQFENSQLSDSINTRLDELSKSRTQIICSLGRAAEFKDNETGLHVVRMSKISREIALEIGLDPETAELLMQAAPMHDVGKIGIPDEVLLKPGKLNSKEWKIMKTHPALGGAILGKGVGRLMHMARTVAIAHHEKWDGSGYPRGLKKEKIPLEARIVSVADIFDALTSKRPYKKAWPIHEAVDYINSQAGKELDERVINAFNQCIDRITNISKSFADR